MKNLIPFLIVPIVCSLLFACDKNDDGQTPPGIQSATIDVRAYDQWIYFSFEQGLLDSPTDPTTNTNWDLAFHRWDVRTNGGASGLGKGGAYAINQTSFDNIPEPDAARLVTDEMILTYMQTPDMSGENNQRVEVPANTELGQWLTVSMSSIPPTYTLANNVFMVRTADGQWAAVRFTNYMNDRAEKGYASFSYLFPIH